MGGTLRKGKEGRKFAEKETRRTGKARLLGMLEEFLAAIAGLQVDPDDVKLVSESLGVPLCLELPEGMMIRKTKCEGEEVHVEEERKSL